jgi:hypothetical protein
MARGGRSEAAWGVARVEAVSELPLDGEILAEEDAVPGERTDPVRPLPVAAEGSSLPVLSADVRSAALAAAGGVLAGAAAVAAVRVVSAAGSRASGARRLARRRQPPAKVIASRSFLVDVHLLGR